MNKWKIVHDCNTEDGEATCWSKEVSIYGRFVWIEGGNGVYDVAADGQTLKICKFLASAKRWVAINIGEHSRKLDSE